MTYTNSSGAFLFSGLKVGDYTPTAQKGTAFQQAVATTPTEVTEGQVTTAPDLLLHPIPGGLHGVVKLSGRAIHSGVNVAASGLSVAGSKQTAATTTDDTGAFTLAGLTAGTWRVTLTAAGFESQTLPEVVVGPAEDVDLGSVTLSPATGSVEGNAKLANATNHEGIRVAVQQAGLEQQATFTNANGAYHFTTVPVGTYSVVATKGGYRRQTESPVVVEAQKATSVAPMTLTEQAGDVWLEDGAGQTLGDATSLAQVRVRGSYPNAFEARFCESPSVQPAAGGDPSTFTLADCAWTALTYSGGAGAPWDAIALSFRPSPCPLAGSPLAVCDGAKTVYVRVRDADSAESDWFELPVVLDRKPPKGMVVIEPDSATLLAGQIANGGAAYTRTASVRVLVSTDEDRSGVAPGGAVSGLSGAWLYRSPTDAAPVSLVVSEGESMVDGINLTSGADGARSLYLKVTDRAGNSSVADLATVFCPDPRGSTLPASCDSVFLDTTPPPSMAFAINPPLPDDFTQGSAYATSPVVRLGLDSTLTGKAEDQAVEITLSNDSTFVAAVSQPLAAPKTVLSWVLSPGDGAKTVYAKVRDAAGNTSARFEASVQLVTVVPEVPLLSPVGDYTRSAKPTLSFAPVTGASAYRLQLCDLGDLHRRGPRRGLQPDRALVRPHHAAARGHLVLAREVQERGRARERLRPGRLLHRGHDRALGADALPGGLADQAEPPDALLDEHHRRRALPGRPGHRGRLQLRPRRDAAAQRDDPRRGAHPRHPRRRPLVLARPGHRRRRQHLALRRRRLLPGDDHASVQPGAALPGRRRAPLRGRRRLLLVRAAAPSATSSTSPRARPSPPSSAPAPPSPRAASRSPTAPGTGGSSRATPPTTSPTRAARRCARCASTPSTRRCRR
ncbi:MAG: carboxypeptidase-like regulatory domain-containing protein [Myxococcales bacterium]